jgi:hypothetical protein
VAFTDLQYITAEIAAGQSLSAQVNLGNATLVAISIPSTWTTASISLQGSPDGGSTWQEVYATDDGANGGEVQFAATAGTFTTITDPTAFYGLNCLKVRSGSAVSAVNQTDAVTVTLIARGFN